MEQMIQQMSEGKMELDEIDRQQLIDLLDRVVEASDAERVLEDFEVAAAEHLAERLRVGDPEKDP